MSGFVCVRQGKLRERNPHVNDLHTWERTPHLKRENGETRGMGTDSPEIPLFSVSRKEREYYAFKFSQSFYEFWFKGQVITVNK